MANKPNARYDLWAPAGVKPTACILFINPVPRRTGTLTETVQNPFRLSAKHLVEPVAKHATSPRYIIIITGFHNPTVSLHRSVLLHHLVSTADSPQVCTHKHW